MLVAVTDAPEDVAELLQFRCADGLGDVGVSGRWCEDEEADWVLVEDQLVVSLDAGGGLWGYDDVFHQVPGVAPAVVGFVGDIRPADGRSEGHFGDFEGDFADFSVSFVGTVAACYTRRSPRNNFQTV